jgi:hypothetical protein
MQWVVSERHLLARKLLAVAPVDEYHAWGRRRCRGVLSGDIPVRAHHVGIDADSQFAEREPSNPLTDWTVSKAALG